MTDQHPADPNRVRVEAYEALCEDPQRVARGILASAMADVGTADDLLDQIWARRPIRMIDDDEARLIGISEMDACRASRLDHVAAKVNLANAIMGLMASPSEYDPDDADDDPTPSRSDG